MVRSVPLAIFRDSPEREGPVASFDQRFAELFHQHFDRLARVMDRLSGEPDLAADVVQDAFVRLYQRGSFPDAPQAWLITVALNLFRNTRTTRRRRARLLTVSRGAAVHSDPAPRPDEAVAADETRVQVRSAIDRMPERDRQLLMLRAEGYSYHDLAKALGISEASVGTLLARAKEKFRASYRSGPHAS